MGGNSACHLGSRHMLTWGGSQLKYIHSLVSNSYLIPLTPGQGAKALVAPEQHFLREISMLPSTTQQEKERENKWCY